MARHMRYYGLEYSRDARWTSVGRLADTLRVFGRRAARDAWLRAGSQYSYQPGYRTALSARDPRVRRWIRREP